VNSTRLSRVAEAIKQEVSDILQNEIKDPRIGFASVVGVEVSRDLRHAKVYISVLGDENTKRETLAGLDNARGFVRSEIARRIRLRYAPEIVFKLDDSIEHGAKINKLLKDLRYREGPSGEG